MHKQMFFNQPRILEIHQEWFDKEYNETQKCLMSLDVVRDKEIHQKHLHEYKSLIQRKRRIWEVTQ